ncbi:MAG: hypothetical protein LBG48_03705 [Rickettsiales bacterium]|jgi:hypothetical protein|nr:hypothetical protein [Rickettsiales bacterium]
MKTEYDLYQILIDIIGKGIQPVLPYQDKYPPPPEDYYTLNIISVRNIGWSQERQGAASEGGVTVVHDFQKIYTVQFDFYGINAIDNVNRYRHILAVGVRKNKEISFKSISEIRNLTELEKNGSFERRYTFDLEFFATDTLIPETGEMYLKRGKILVINRGNNR